jgi:predicted Fe-Mo cluster-binding NifX family protein
METQMRICIPADTNEGAKSSVSGHFGSAPWFHVVDLETGHISVVANGGSHHEHGACRPLDGLAGQEITAVVCRGIGRNAEARLRAAGIDVYLTDAAAVGDVVADARANRLRPVEPHDLCGGAHAHHHGGGPASNPWERH